MGVGHFTVTPYVNTKNNDVQDGFSDVGVHDGSTPKPAVLASPSAQAGGRVTNGYTWIEDLAADTKATLKGYAVRGVDPPFSHPALNFICI